MKIFYIFPFLLAVIITSLYRTYPTDKVVLDFLDFSKTSFKETLPLAKSGSHIAQFNLGLMYKTGKGVGKNNQKAAKWFRQAADQGYDRAQYYLAKLYLIGSPTLQQDQQACRWLTRAAKQGERRAQANLGVMYGLGRGVPKDFVLALKWFILSYKGELEKAMAEAMTPLEIQKAKKQAREFKPRNEMVHRF